jgi:aspartate racemase
VAILGIIGGIGPPSTELYYRYAVEEAHSRWSGAIPRVIIDSLDAATAAEILALLEANRRADLAALLTAEVQVLASAGAAVVILASNTVHSVFDEVLAKSPVPMVSIVEASSDLVAGARRVGLVATSLTMRAGIYQAALARRQVAVAVPADEEQRLIDEAYFGELVRGEFRQSTRQALANVIERLVKDDAIEAALLAGTELPLLIPPGSLGDVRLVDTARAHVVAALAMMGR